MSSTSQQNASAVPNFASLNPSKISEKLDLKATILSGHHKGASISFPNGRKEPILVGSSIENDIVLLSADIADSHLIVRPNSFIKNKISISSKNGTVELEDGQIVNIGQWVETTLPAKISFGDTTILFEREFGMTQISKLIKPGLLLLSSIIIGVIGATFVANQTNIQKMKDISYITQAPTEITLNAKQQKERQNKTATALKQQISKIQLDNYLSVQDSSDGTVIVTGIIPEDLMGQWRSILQWYDGQPDMVYLVNNVSLRKIVNFELSIKSVWLDGNDRVVILSNGKMARIGDIIEGGWIIKDILDDHIVVNRHDQTIKITY